jgi:hypothetical protein
MEKYKKIVIYITLVTIFSLTACTAALLKNWGKIEPDADVTNDFEKFQINANFNYYISGSDVYPTSILGLNKAYTLDTDLWKKIEMTPEIFNQIITNMQMRLLSCCGQKQVGFMILDDKGKKIGIWYSMLMGSIGVKMKEDSKVIIYPPRDDVYIQYEDKTVDGKW